MEESSGGGAGSELMVDPGRKYIRRCSVEGKGAMPAEGLEAYREIHQWYARQTPMGIQELRQRIMKPAQARTEMEVAQRMEEWNEAEIELARSDPS